MVVKGPENKKLVELIDKLSKDKSKFWKSISKLLSKPRRKRVAVNIDKINKYAKDGNFIVVPGKVLGDGTLEKSVVIAAFSFSKGAKEKIEKAGGKGMSIEEGHKELKDFKDTIILV
ncbi:MAG: 50S ribosomal protein L18e [Methanobacteriota archaeon]|nr:MAG: 50S ribosomal protein L18e [Euryarchaeota archaeon]